MECSAGLGWPLKPIEHISICGPLLKPLGIISNIPGAYPEGYAVASGPFGRRAARAEDAALAGPLP